ncbi:MAG: hypothetical protein OSB41_02935 [Kiritimatiellae bacterium]|nr:hypothetical protein [Kiritimatiellia bacterium]
MYKTTMKRHELDFDVVNTHLSSSSGVVFNQPSRDGDLGSAPEASFLFAGLKYDIPEG